ncbi:MAG: hypothetical protein AAF654_12355 [Myxococcota bacterium]
MRIYSNLHRAFDEDGNGRLGASELIEFARGEDSRGVARNLGPFLIAAERGELEDVAQALSHLNSDDIERLNIIDQRDRLRAFFENAGVAVPPVLNEAQSPTYGFAEHAHAETGVADAPTSTNSPMHFSLQPPANPAPAAASPSWGYHEFQAPETQSTEAFNERFMSFMETLHASAPHLRNGLVHEFVSGLGESDHRAMTRRQENDLVEELVTPFRVRDISFSENLREQWNASGTRYEDFRATQILYSQVHSDRPRLVGGREAWATAAALAQDPRVSGAIASWDSLDGDARREILQRSVDLTARTLGVETTEVVFYERLPRFGDPAAYYHPGRHELGVRSTDEAMEQPLVWIVTAAHEVAHRAQYLLADRWERGELSAEDPNYELGRTFSLERDFAHLSFMHGREAPSREGPELAAHYQRMAYEGSPGEQEALDFGPMVLMSMMQLLDR